MVAPNIKLLEKIQKETYELQTSLREISKLRREILEDYELINKIYLCLDNSLDSFVEEGLFATTRLFDNVYDRVNKKYKGYNLFMQENNDLLGTYESTIHKLDAMKKKTNQEISIRNKFQD